MNATHSTESLSAAMLLGLLILGACDKRPNDPATPRAGISAPAGTLPVTPSAPDPTVPPATSGLAAPATASLGAAAADRGWRSLRFRVSLC